MPRLDLAATVAALDAGGVVAVPTESSFALAARLDRPTAIAELQTLKPERDKPIGVVVDHPRTLPGWVRDVSPLALDLVRAFWPGPLTIVFEATGNVPAAVHAGSGTVGVRQPDCAPLLELLARVGVPLTATSANRPGEPPICTVAELEATWPELRIWDVFDRTPGGPPSTVVTVVGGVPEVVRAGAITL